MKIGLVRHFKVKHELPKAFFISKHELIRWFEDYDSAEIEYGEVDLGGIEWKRCFSSDLPRAVKTAEKFFDGKIIALEALRELAPYFGSKRDYKLPLFLWIILVRIRTLAAKTFIKDLNKKIAAVLDEKVLPCDEDVLIVSHGFVMMFMRQALQKRGFVGPQYGKAENGKLYIFDKRY